MNLKADSLNILERAAWWPSLPFETGDLGYASWQIMGRGTPPRLSEIHCPNQVHSTVITVPSANTSAEIPRLQRPPGDGIFTCTPGETVGVQTADCVPLLLANRKMVMAVHGGWRGLANGILDTAAANFREQNVPLSDVDVIIGPAISSRRFEIGPEVVAAFGDGPHGLDPAAFALCFQKGHSNRWHADLQAFSVMALVARGIDPARIRVVRACTFDHPESWYSFRRDGAGTGSNWSVISLVL